MGLRTFVLGSCVSRDTLAHAGADAFPIVRYVARQSLASTAAPPGAAGVDVSGLASPFQRRVTLGALHGNAVRLLAAAAAKTDLVLLDLVDERLGLIDLGDGRLLTRSIELIAAGVDQQLTAEHEVLPFGSDRHFVAWRAGFGLLVAGLEQQTLLDRTLLLAPPWAGRTTAGRPAPTSFGMSAGDWARLAAPYVAHAAAALPPDAVLGADVRVASTPDHQWGGAPFHYCQDTYGRLCAELRVATRRVTGHPRGEH